MRTRSLLLAVLLCAAAAGASAQGSDLRGTVTDTATGRPLAGAAVEAPDVARVTATDSAGHFVLTGLPGAVRLVVRAVGYETREIAEASGRLNVALVAVETGEAVLGEAVVTDTRPEATRPERQVEMGRVALSGADVRAMPALLGESDVLRTLQLLPGVRGGQDGGAGLVVRGGSPDQTLVLLDGVPVYNAAHLFGFLSTFNGDAVDTAELTSGAYPARYGGRLGSVLDVQTRDGDLKRAHVQGQLGILSARILAEGPLVPGRLSALVSARRTYVNTLAAPFVARANARAAERGDIQVQPRVSFDDLNARVAWRPSDRDRVSVSVYDGGDSFGFETVDPVEACTPGMGCRSTGTTDAFGGGLDWGNRVASLRYTRVVSPRVLATAALTSSDYRLNVALDVEDGVGGDMPRTSRARYRSAIRDRVARVDLDVAAGRGHTLRLGASVSAYRFTPGALSLSLSGEDAGTGAALDTLLGSDATRAAEGAVYAEDEIRVGRLALSLGLRAALYTAGRWRYPSVEPRVSAAFRLHDRVALKASAARTQQPVHLLTTGAGVGLPADLWVPADSLGPERGWQMGVGVAASSPSGRTTLTLDAYRRAMRGLLAYRDGAGFTSATADYQDLVVTGSGSATGVEALVRHRTSRVTAWLAYTLARAERQFDALDAGQPFPYRYDHRHALAAVALVRLSRRLDVSAAFTYGTGDAVTLPTATYDAAEIDYGSVDYWVSADAQSRTATAYGPRNRYRLPAAVRLDVGATLFFRRGERPHALALSVYNATNRKNPFLTTYETQTDAATGTNRQQLIGVVLFPILPSLSYQFGF